MSVEHIPAVVVLVLICIILALGMWYVGVRSGSLRAKQFAVMIGIFPFLAIGLQLAASWFGGNSRADYRSAAIIGSWNRRDRAKPVADETPFPVIDAEVKHQLILTPKPWGADPTTQPVRLHFSVKSPKGDILAQGEQELAPAKNGRWSQLRAEFQPREEGQHTLTLEIPWPVGSVDIVVHELRK